MTVVPPALPGRACNKCLKESHEFTCLLLAKADMRDWKIWPSVPVYRRPDSIAKPAAPRAPGSHPSEFGAAVLAGFLLYSVFSTKSLSAPDSVPQTSPLRPASCRTPA